MKKVLMILLTVALVMLSFGSLAESGFQEISAPAGVPARNAYGEFVVGATTRTSGMFFTDMWGNNTADNDVRNMIHGYSPVVWTQQSLFEMDPTVVDSVTTGVNDAGNRVYMITLHPGLTYNDGTLITSRDYVFSFLLRASPVVQELEGDCTSALYIAGADAYLSGAASTFSGLRIIDEMTFLIEMKAESLPFFYETGLLYCVPYPISEIAPGCEVVDLGAGAFIRNVDPAVTAPIFTADLLRETVFHPATGYMTHPKVTSGPYTLIGYNAEIGEARFAINGRYKGNYEGHTPSIDNVVLCNVTPDMMMDTLLRGEVQLLNKTVAGDVIMEGLSKFIEGIIQSKTYPRLGFGYLAFSCEQGPMQFEAVRKAVAHSVDVDAFNAAFTQNYGMPVYGYYGVGQWMYLMILGNLMPAVFEPGDEVIWADMADQIDLNSDSFALNTYPIDLDAAEQLLINDGWTLNDQGAPFVKGADSVRYKMVDSELMSLTLRWGKIQDSEAADILEWLMVEPLAWIGIKVETDVVPFEELLEHYYRQTDRVYDMMYLASNFHQIFDPYKAFNTADEYQGTLNTTGFRDTMLEQLALDLRRTENQDQLGYCQKWLAFQKYFNEKLPMLPLYSNTYFDFFTPELQNYLPDSNSSWSNAIVSSFIGAEGMPEWYQLELDAEALMEEW